MSARTGKTLVELTTHVVGGPRLLVDHTFEETKELIRNAPGGFVELAITPVGWDEQNFLCINRDIIVMVWPQIAE